MQVLDETLNLEGFWARVRAAPAPARALLLDYDGTMAPFRVERDQAVPYPGVREAVARILRAGHTRLVVVTGRYSRDLPPLLGLDPRPEIWATHGWEHLLPDDHYEIASIDTVALDGLRRARDWAQRMGWGDLLESKPAGLALHVRSLGPAGGLALLDRALPAWAGIAKETGLGLLEFDGGVELRAPGQNKGMVTRTILDQIGPDGAMAFLGDDQTDEDAFDVLARLATGDRALSVLVRGQPRPTRARLWLVPPGELLAFLHRWDQEATDSNHELHEQTNGTNRPEN